MPSLLEEYLDEYNDTFRIHNVLEVVCDENEKLRTYTKLQHTPSLDVIDKKTNVTLSKEGREYFDENLEHIQKAYELYNKIWYKNFRDAMWFPTIKYLEPSIFSNDKNLKKYTGINVISHPKNEDEKELIDAISKQFKSYNGNKKLDIEIVINRLDSGSWIRRYFSSGFTGIFSTQENYLKGVSSANLDINYYDNKEKIASLNFAHYTGNVGAEGFTITSKNKGVSWNSWEWSFLRWLGIPTMKRDTIEAIENFTIDNFIKDK